MGRKAITRPIKSVGISTNNYAQRNISEDYMPVRIAIKGDSDGGSFHQLEGGYSQSSQQDRDVKSQNTCEIECSSNKRL